MKTALIYHNPRCSKSRQTLAILEEHTLEIKVVKYLEQPPSTKQIKEILTMLSASVDEIMRSNESEYKDFIKGKNLSDQEKIKIINRHPKILERPIVIIDEKAVIGRPPESVLEII